MTEKWQYSYVEKWADESGVYERVTFDSLEKAEKYHRDSVEDVAELNAEVSNPDDQIVATVEKRRVVEPGPWEPVDASSPAPTDDVREALTDTLVMTRLSDFAGTDMGVIAQAADAILSRFHVTPKEEQ